MPKKKKVKFQKRKSFVSNKLELLFAKSKVSNIAVRTFRQRKVGNKVKIKSKSSSSIMRPISIFFSLRKNLLTKIIIGLIVGVMIYVGWSFLKQYNSINFTPYLKDSSAQATSQDNLGYVGPEYNVLLSGFEKISNNRFAESVIFLSLNSKTGNLKVISINPTFVTNSTQSAKKYTLKSMINNVGSDDPAFEFSKTVENLLGVRVDRYVDFDIEKFKEFLNSWSVSMKTIDSFNATTGFFNKDNTISKNALGEYLFTLDSKSTYDTLANRQLSFFTQFIQNNRNLPFYLKAFWSSDSLTDLFHTNMSKSEMSGFLTNLMSSNLPSKNSVLDSTLGLNYATESEAGLTPNLIEFDNKIKDTMLNIDIVREQVSIEVYNASSTSGYASKIKRIFQNVGANIINANNYPEKVEGIKLYIPNQNAEKFPNNISAIETYFGGDIDIIIGDYKYNHTADLILVLGEPKSVN